MRSAAAEIYVLSSSLPAVRLSNPHKGTIVFIPADATISVPGTVSLAGFVDVVWSGDPYAVFSVDLEERAAQLDPAFNHGLDGVGSISF